MLETLMGIKDFDGLTAYGVKLLNGDNRCKLEHELFVKSLIFQKEKCWPRSKMMNFARHPNTVVDGLKQTLSEDFTTSVLHRLQLLGVCCPAVVPTLTEVLKKTTF